MNDRGGRRRRIGIRLALALGFGGLVLLAVLAVLGLGIGSAQRNTRDLLEDRARDMVRAIRSEVVDELRPIEHQVNFVASWMEQNRSGNAFPPDDQLATLLTGALAASPSTFRIAYISESGSLLGAERRGSQARLIHLSAASLPQFGEALTESASTEAPYWGSVVWHPEAKSPIINYRRPLRAGGHPAGLIGASIRTDRMSVALGRAAATIDGKAFILLGDDRVLAHPHMTDAAFGRTADAPLPSVSAFDDPVLQAVAAGRGESRVLGKAGFTTFVVNDGDRAWIALMETISDFGPVPWRLVIYFPLTDVTAEIQRLLTAAVAGLVVLLLAVILALYIARRLSRPLVRLAEFADRARQLELDDIGTLPPSRILELDQAAHSMNAMIAGLRWFEAYVPKRLVQTLMARADAVGTGGREIEATVLFTDISGFTSITEHWPAARTADFLNRHFNRIAGQIEATGGTIDKFIGDSVMAFWGAPEAQPDHAERAVRAARAIAETLEADARRRAGEGKNPIRVRIGIHSGPVVVGNIGAKGRMNYTIVGDTVNTANRLEQAGRDATDGVVVILASRATVEAAHIADARPIGSVALRGREEPLEVFRI